VEAVDLSGGGGDGDCGVAFYVAFASALQSRRIQAGTVVLGDVTVQGNIKQPTSISESLQVAFDNGALRALVPLAKQVPSCPLPEEVVEKLDVVFYGDVDRAILKAVGARRDPGQPGEVHAYACQPTAHDPGAVRREPGPDSSRLGKRAARAPRTSRPRVASRHVR
jgi:hypothetical protein